MFLKMNLVLMVAGLTALTAQAAQTVTCTLRPFEEVPVLRVELQKGAQAETIPDSYKIRIPADKIVRVEKLNGQYFNGDYAGYKGYFYENLAVIHTDVPHPVTQFQVTRECGQDLPDGVCLLKLKQGAEDIQSVLRALPSKDLSLKSEYGLEDGELQLYQLMTNTWVEYDRATGQAQLFAMLASGWDDSAYLRLPISFDGTPARAKLEVSNLGPTSTYKLGATHPGPKNNRLEIECR
jgi:hypothetical protein